MERTNSTNNILIIKALESLKMPAADRMQHFDAYINPLTHQVNQTIYLARKNPKPADNTDHFEILSWTQPQAAEDEAAPGKCKLVPYEQVRTVDA
jgi:branched-chain amino acid transport system substrate-binding protein